MFGMALLAIALSGGVMAQTVQRKTGSTGTGDYNSVEHWYSD